MTEFRSIRLEDIDTVSRVNVRRTEVEKNVKLLEQSISAGGYWPEHPVVVRPHPDAGSGYTYENVAGQRRITACRRLGLAEIQAVVAELNDEEAIQRSWSENSDREALSIKDEVHWIEHLTLRYQSDGTTGKEALKRVADFLNLSPETIRKRIPLKFLPQDVMEQVEKGTLRKGEAEAIAKSVAPQPESLVTQSEENEQMMRERAKWLLAKEKDDRKRAAKAMDDHPNKSLEELDAIVKDGAASAEWDVRYTVPPRFRDDLAEWGANRGISGAGNIVGAIIAAELSRQ